MTQFPAWWDEALPEIDGLLSGFTEKVEVRLRENPEKIFRRKNPFLYRLRGSENAVELADTIISAYISSSEETMFGTVMGKIAAVVCKYGKGGWSSGIAKIDLEYDEDGQRKIVQVKSGPNWGNSSQHGALRAAFTKATQTLRQSDLLVVCIEGISYGKTERRDLGTHIRYTGDAFWEEISGHPRTAENVMEVIGTHAGNGLLDVRAETHSNMVDYLNETEIAVSDEIDWDRLLSTVMGN